MVREENSSLLQEKNFIILDDRNRKYMGDLKKKLRKATGSHLTFNKIFTYLLGVIEANTLESDVDKSMIKALEPSIREVLKGRLK